MVQKIGENTPRVELGYGEGYVNGLLSSEKICFGEATSNKCIDQVQMVFGDGGAGLERDRFAGIIGLAPKGDNKAVPAFLSQIHGDSNYNPGLDKSLSPVFSFYLGKGEGSKGMLTFGGYDLEKYAVSGSKE